MFPLLSFNPWPSVKSVVNSPFQIVNFSIKIMITIKITMIYYVPLPVLVDPNPIQPSAFRPLCG